MRKQKETNAESFTNVNLISDEIIRQLLNFALLTVM